MLESHLDTVARVVDEVDELAARSAVLESRSQLAFQRIGFVRFNPFEDTGGNQSFALALLDGRQDGIVISSLHTRTATRIYAKAVSGGQPDGAMSDEERQAVELARSTSAGRTMDGTLDVRIARPAPTLTAAQTPAPPPLPVDSPSAAVAGSPMGGDAAR